MATYRIVGKNTPKEKGATRYRVITRKQKEQRRNKKNRKIIEKYKKVIKRYPKYG